VIGHAGEFPLGAKLLIAVTAVVRKRSAPKNLWSMLAIKSDCQSEITVVPPTGGESGALSEATVARFEVDTVMPPSPHAICDASSATK
jgi:hypothetical protein